MSWPYLLLFKTKFGIYTFLDFSVSGNLPFKKAKKHKGKKLKILAELIRGFSSFYNSTRTSLVGAHFAVMRTQKPLF